MAQSDINEHLLAWDKLILTYREHERGGEGGERVQAGPCEVHRAGPRR